MAGFTKLYSDIITSSIWSEDDHTRILWVTMLALADAAGFVPGSIPGLAAVARLTTDACRQSMAKLEAPDADSRTKEHDGRRIEPCDGGWLILNYAKFRNRRDFSDTPDAIRQRRHRSQQRDNAVTGRDNAVTGLRHSASASPSPSDSSGESEGGTKPAPAAKLTNWTEPEEWAKLAYTAFTATPPPTFPSPLLVHQCAGLIAAGRTKPEFQSLVDWRRTTHNSHAPNSPTTLCDPEKWEQWHSMKRKEENGDDQDHRSDRSRGTANAGTHASYKKPFGISRPQG